MRNARMQYKSSFRVLRSEDYYTRRFRGRNMTETELREFAEGRFWGGASMAALESYLERRKVAGPETVMQIRDKAVRHYLKMNPARARLWIQANYTSEE